MISQEALHAITILMLFITAAEGLNKLKQALKRYDRTFQTNNSAR